MRDEITKMILINKATGTLSYFCSGCGYKSAENRRWCLGCCHEFENEEVYYKDDHQ